MNLALLVFVLGNLAPGAPAASQDGIDPPVTRRVPVDPVAEPGAAIDLLGGRSGPPTLGAEAACQEVPDPFATLPGAPAHAFPASWTDLGRLTWTSGADTYGSESGEKSDMAFMRYARDHADSPELTLGTAKVLEIPLNWQPPSAVEARLAAAGYQCDAIAHYRELFVISAREQGRPLRDPGKAFLAYCQCVCRIYFL